MARAARSSQAEIVRWAVSIRPAASSSSGPQSGRAGDASSAPSTAPSAIPAQLAAVRSASRPNHGCCASAPGPPNRASTGASLEDHAVRDRRAHPGAAIPAFVDGDRVRIGEIDPDGEPARPPSGSRARTSARSSPPAPEQKVLTPGGPRRRAPSPPWPGSPRPDAGPRPRRRRAACPRAPRPAHGRAAPPAPERRAARPRSDDRRGSGRPSRRHGRRCAPGPARPPPAAGRRPAARSRPARPPPPDRAIASSGKRRDRGTIALAGTRRRPRASIRRGWPPRARAGDGGHAHCQRLQTQAMRPRVLAHHRDVLQRGAPGPRAGRRGPGRRGPARWRRRSATSRVAANISAAESPRQSCVSVVHPISRRSRSRAICADHGAVSPHGVRHRAGVTPSPARRRSARSVSRRSHATSRSLWRSADRSAARSRAPRRACAA